MAKEINQVGKLGPAAEAVERTRLRSISPDDGKYHKAVEPLRDFLGPEAEWRAFSRVQVALIQTRHEYGQATAEQVQEVKDALAKIDPLNMSLLEDNVTRHDQLAVLEEIGRHVRPETKALLHPGTTSYDVVDTARAHLFRGAWQTVMRPKVLSVINRLCDLAENNADLIRAGRTHLQHTSPVPVGKMFADTARRLAERVQKTDAAFGSLRGKVSGIVGTGASVEMVVGDGRAGDFERDVLKKLDLEPDPTATQVTGKENLADCGHYIGTLMSVAAEFADNVRLMHSSEIKELVSSDTAGRLGGSSADAAKDNPINWENIAGKLAVVLSGMPVLHAMLQTNFERDLRSSVQARYQPAGMMAQTHESFTRMDKALQTLAVHEDNVKKHVQNVREFPSEAMVAILRGEGWIHPEHGDGNDFVKAMSIRAKKEGRPLLAVSLEDPHFKTLFGSLPEKKQKILQGNLELYTGNAVQKLRENVQYARAVAAAAPHK